MFRQIKSFVLVALTFGVVMSCSAPALAAKQKSLVERYRNETGVTAKCLKKYIDKWTVSKATSDKFAACTVTPVGDYYVITCTDDTGVEDNGKVRVSATGSSGSNKAEVLCTKWYSDAACSTFEGYAEPVASTTATKLSNLTVTVEHLAQEVNDANGAPGTAQGTVYGRDVHYAVAGRYRPVEELNESLFADTSIGWKKLNDFDLEYDESTSFDLGEYDPAAVLLFRFYTEDEDQPTLGHSGYELLQFCMIGTCIPAVSQWGMLVIALLLAAGGTIVIRRRRTMAT